MSRLWEETPVNPLTFRDTAVFMTELFKMLVVLLHVTRLAKVTTYKKREEKAIKHIFLLIQ